MDKKTKFRQNMALGLTLAMSLGTIPYNVLANSTVDGISKQMVNFSMVGNPNNGQVDATSSATYYKKANWENKIKDKSRWKVEEDQNLVRVGGSDPLQMNDIDYDGMFIDANGRYVIRLVYKEKSQAVSGVWYRALINFGDLDKFIDFDLSYVLGKDGKTQYKFDPVTGTKGRGFDLGEAAGDRTNNRKNLPINLVLKEGVDLDKLGDENYIVQMRITDGNYKKVYAYAPKGTSMDYSTYTKTTAVDLVDKLGTLFLKGGKQSDLNNATNQEFFMSEFIANPDQYPDKSNLGIIRTQYKGQTNPIVRETVGGQPFAFTQVFDANLVKYMKADSKSNVAYVNVMTKDRKLFDYTKNVGIPKDKINYSKDGKLAYIVIGTKAFKKDGVKVVNVEKNDQHTMLSGFYITAIDYVVDKGQFENTFSNDKVRKLNYTTMSGWTNPNKDGWVVYEKEYKNDYVVPEGESYLIDTGDNPTGEQIMLQVGGDQAILRKPQGYYNGYVSGDGANDAIEKYANGVYKITLREGATIFKGKKLKVYMPYTASHDKPVNFLEINNATKRNEGAATLTLNNDRNITMHIYKEGKKGHFVLKYTLADGTESSMEFTPKVLWKYSDKDRILTGVPNTSADGAGGNFYINTKKLKPGADIFVESYDGSGNKIDSETSWFKYVPLTKANDNVKLLTWVDHSDKKSVLSINKSLYTPYQLLFTNDYAEGTDDFYTNPRVLPADNTKFNTDTTSFVGYTKYDGGKVRTLYEEGKVGKLYAKVEADENEYDDKGNLVGKDVSKKITIPKSNIFDAQFAEDSKEYKAYEYKVDLTKMLPYHSEDKSAKTLELKKDMKFVSTASDGSSLPSDLYETRVRARVLFDTTEGQFADNTKKSVKIVPDNTKFYGEEGYAPNGFEGANVEANTGDKFPEAPTLAGKNFLGWVTEAGKKALGGKAVVAVDAFGKLTKEQIFTNETPVTKHLVVYAIYSEDVAVTFDANEGKFGDGKDTTSVKVEGGNVTKPADPTRVGYKFLGWAATKDAKEADANILNDVTSPKTVYAVWEKTAEELKLNDPTPVEVKDLKSLTTDEKDKVTDAVIAANSTLTKAEITVADDGTVTVKTKDGKTGTLAPEKTVKQKEVQNNFNPPKEPVKVENAKALTEDEIKQVKQAVKDANPDRNFKDEDITVEADGTVKINQGGKIGTIPAEKTVVQKDTILDLNKPSEKVEVKNPDNLSQGEKDKVADAVKKANENKITNNADVTVDSKGNVTVKDGNKTGTLKSEDTVKPFTRDGKTLNPPAEKVKVGDKNKLTEFEKQQVRDEVKKANPDLGLTDADIEVDPNGETRILISDGKYATFKPEKTVDEIKETDNLLKLVAPTRTEVANKNSLTIEEKQKVVAAVLANNDTLGLVANDIKVANDGSVTVEKNGKTGQLAQADTVEEKLKTPVLNAAKDGSVTVKPSDDNANVLEVKYIPAGSDTETALNATKTKGKWKLPEGTDAAITIDENTGEITIPANKVKNNSAIKAKAIDENGKSSEEATINSNDATAPQAPTVTANKDGSVTVTPPTDKDTKTVEVTYTDNDGNKKTVTATKDDAGKWSVPEGSDVKVDPETGVITVPADKVKDGTEVSAVAKDNSGNASTPTDTSKANAKTPGESDTTAPAAPKVEAKDDGSVTVTPPTDADTKEVEVTYTDNDGNKKTVTATKDDAGKWSVPEGSDVKVDPETGVITVPADKVKDGTEVSAVAKDNSGNASTPTDTSKANAKTPEDKDAPQAPTVTANKDGSVTVTPPTDKDTKTVEVTYTDNDGNKKTVTATKDDAGKWSVPEGSDVKVDPETGVITVPADKVKDGTEVSAVAKDNSGNASTPTDTSKANAKTPEDKDAPQAPTVTANKDGSVTVTPPTDKDTKTVEVTYTDNDGNKKTVTATKDDAGKWSVPEGSDVKVDPETGVITVPADKVKDGTEVSAVAKDNSGNASTATDTSKANAKTPEDKDAPQAPTVTANKDGSVTVTPPTDKDTKTVEVTYTDNDGNKKTVTATKDDVGKWSVPEGSDVKVDPETGVITVPADKVKDGTEVSAVAKDNSGNASTATDTSKANAKTPEDKDAPQAPTVTANKDGSVTVTPPTDKDTKTVEVTYTDNDGNKKTVTATKDDAGKWSVPEGSDVKVDPETGVITVPADKVKDGTEVSAVAKDNSGNASTPTDTSKANAKTPGESDTTAPAAPKVEAKDDGSVTVTPPTDADTKEVEVTYTDNDGNKKTVTATKDDAGKWSVPEGSDVKVDPETGVITVPADKVKDGTEVSAVAKDNSGNASTATDTSKANAKTPEDKDAPQAPTVTANKDGSVTVTPPTDKDTKTVEVTYTDNDGNKKTVTATKDDAGKWSVPEGSDVKVDPETGVITVPADKVKDGTEVSAVAKDNSGNASTPTDTSKANAKTPGTTKPDDTTPDNGKKALLPTDDYQDTGINLGDTSNLDSISAIDEDGSYVPVYVDNNGNIIVKPGKDVDGPIKVTINKDGKERVIFIDILGHSMGHDDNGYRPGYFDGSYNIPGIRYRDYKTPTHPVTVTVPEKTETGVKVHDTLWYVFHINEFQYEVVRNGVVTKRLMDVTPVLQNGRTMLPLRYVAEALQADVKWDAKTRTATFTKDGLTASIQIDSDEIVLSNGKTVKMDSKPLNINDRIIVSVTNVANVFGLTNGNTKDKADQDIEWEQQDKSATIYIRR